MVVDTANVLNNVANPKTESNSPVIPFALAAILSVTTIGVVSKKRKAK